MHVSNEHLLCLFLLLGMPSERDKQPENKKNNHRRMVLKRLYINTSLIFCDASFSKMAECTRNPDSLIIFAPSSAFVPCRRTIIGTGITPIFLYASTTPVATRSQRTMPPKIFIKMAF